MRQQILKDKGYFCLHLQLRKNNLRFSGKLKANQRFKAIPLPNKESG